MESKKRLSNEIILQASQGDSEAIAAVLEFYMPYINTIATEWGETEDQSRSYRLNEDRKSYIITYLIEAIKRWRVI